MQIQRAGANSPERQVQIQRAGANSPERQVQIQRAGANSLGRQVQIQRAGARVPERYGISAQILDVSLNTGCLVRYAIFGPAIAYLVGHRVFMPLSRI